MLTCSWLSERCAAPVHWVAVKLFDANHVPGRAGCVCTPCIIDRNLDDAWRTRGRGRPHGRCQTTAFFSKAPDCVAILFYPSTTEDRWDVTQVVVASCHEMDWRCES